MTMRGCVLVVALWSAVLLPASVLGQPVQLLSEERLAQEAVLIGAVLNNRHIHQAIFPDIKFTCAGNISKWAVVAVPVAGGTRYPALQVWRRGSSAREFVRIKRSKLTSSSPNPVGRVYEVIEDTPVAVQTGDFFGVYNPTVPRLSFRYQQNGAALNYYTQGNVNGRDTFDLDATLYVVHSGDDYPLVSVDVDPPECVSGFLDYSTVVRKASLLTGTSSNLQYDGATQRVIPALAFPAPGLIHNITIGGIWDTREDTIPEIQLWRATGQGMWTKSAAVSSNAVITPNIALNVHRYTPFTPLEVQAGDILGFYQPSTSSSRFMIYLLRGGPDNYIQSSTTGPLDTITQRDTQDALPLITVGFMETPPGSTPVNPVTGSSRTKVNPVTQQTTNSSTTGRPDASSRTTVIVLASLFSVTGGVVVLGVFILGVSFLVVKWIKRPKPYSRAAPHHYDLPAHVGPPRPPPPSSYNSSQMEYNVNYTLKNPNEVIINGKKKTVDLVSNSAYGTDSASLTRPAGTSTSAGPPAASPTVGAANPLSDRVYEDISGEF